MNGRPLLLSLSLLLLLAIPAAAQTANNEVAVSLGFSELGDFGNAPAIGASFNHYWGARTSFRIGAFAASGEFDNDAGENSVKAVYAAAELHFRRGQFVSPYAGVGGAMASTEVGEMEFEFSDSETAIAPMITFGADFNLSPRFALGVDGHWMYLRGDLGSRFPYVIDPITVMASAKYRF